MYLLGLAMALGGTLPAEAHMQPQPSPMAQAMALDYTNAAPTVAMGHGANSATDHSTEDHGAVDEPEDPIQPRPSDAVPLTPATHGDHFAVGFPQGWVVADGETAPQITAHSPAGEPAITTEVSWQAEAPGQVMSALLADIREKDYTVARYDAIAMDSTTAIRLWLTDLPEPDLPYAFITVVGYSDATAILISRYETPNDDLDNLLSQIHQSFQRRTPAAAPDTHHP